MVDFSKFLDDKTARLLAPRLGLKDAQIAQEKLDYLEKMIDGGYATTPKGHTTYMEAADAYGRKVTADDDGFVLDSPKHFKLAPRVAPAEFAEIKKRTIGYHDIQIENIDIMAELAKL